MPFCFNLYVRCQYHILSNASGMSKKMALTWFIGYRSWLTHESAGGKPSWLSDIKLFSVINPKDFIGFSQ